MEDGKIVYRFTTPIYPANILYVNLIAKYSCTNDCLFCSRPRKRDDFGKPNIYEKKAGANLYLRESPSVNEVLRIIEKEIDLGSDKEIAFIGLGEPLIYFPKIAEIISLIRKKYTDIKIRIDTNGLVKCMFPNNPAKKLKQAGLNEIRISLNAINEEEYNLLCRPKFDNAFRSLVEFIQDCIKAGLDTYVSFVVHFKHGEIESLSEQDYINFALSLGVKGGNVILREYVEEEKTKPLKRRKKMSAEKKEIFVVTTGIVGGDLTGSLADPGMTREGRRQISQLSTYLTLYASSLSGKPNYFTVICGKGKRHKDIAEALALIPDRFSGVLGTGALLVKKELWHGEIMQIILPSGIYLDPEKYTTLKDLEPAIRPLIISLPDNSVVCTDNSTLVTLGVKDAKSAALYKIVVEADEISSIKEMPHRAFREGTV